MGQDVLGPAMGCYYFTLCFWVLPSILSAGIRVQKYFFSLFRFSLYPCKGLGVLHMVAIMGLMYGGIPTKQVDFSLPCQQAQRTVKETLKEFIAWYTG
jgi:hypothetical protein